METVILILVLYLLPLFISYLIASRLEGASTVGEIAEHLFFIFFPILNIGYIIIVGTAYWVSLIIRSKWWEKFKEIKLP